MKNLKCLVLYTIVRKRAIMEIRKYFCDKCNKELIWDEKKNFWIEYDKLKKVGNETFTEKVKKHLDLCKECYFKLQETLQDLLEGEQ